MAQPTSIEEMLRRIIENQVSDKAELKADFKAKLNLKLDTSQAELKANIKKDLQSKLAEIEAIADSFQIPIDFHLEPKDMIISFDNPESQ